MRVVLIKTMLFGAIILAAVYASASEGNFAAEVDEWTDARDGSDNSTISYTCKHGDKHKFSIKKSELKRMKVTKILKQLDEGCD